jgi:tetratricopeptide (TPR) repeat protein
MAYATRTADFLLAAHELNVQLLVDGNVQRFGHRLRVHVQAWNISDGSSRLSEKFDAEITELFDLQDRIADSLAKELAPNLSQPPREYRPTGNAQAYELFLRAMERMTRNNRWDTRIAVEMLENATVLDEKFADAWAGLAEACVQMGGIFEPGSKWITRAEKAMRCSLSLDHENIEAHIANGRIVWTPSRNFQHRAALYALKEALRRRPTHDQALSWQGCILMHIGLQLEAKESLTSALAVCPDNAFTLTFLGTNSVYAGEYSEAREYYARALSLDRTSLWANLLSPAAPLYAGQLEQASQAIRAARQILPKDSLLTSYEALLWAKRGERRKAENTVQKALHGHKTLLHTHHMMHTVAAAYAMLEKPQQAMTWLRKASSTGLPIYPAYRDDPHFSGMRNDPQFLRFLTHLKRKWTSFKVEFGHQGNPK